MKGKIGVLLGGAVLIMLLSPAFAAWMCRVLAWCFVGLHGVFDYDFVIEPGHQLVGVSKWIETRWNLKPEVDPIPYPEIEAKDYTVEKFKKITKNYYYPAVIRGLMNGSRADKKWDLDYLTGVFGDQPVMYRQGKMFHESHVKEVVTMLRDGTKTANYKHIKVKSTNDQAGDNDHPSVMNYDPFRVFAKVIKDGGAAQLYDAMAHDILMQSHPDLLREVEVRRLGLDLFKGFTPRPRPRYTPVFTDFFISGCNDTHKILSRFHSALAMNMFYMVRGSKTWTVVDPYYSLYLKPVMHIGLRPTMVGGSTRIEPTTDPFYPRIPRWTTTVHQGDVLFNPGNWWHMVKSLDRVNIAIATREASMGNALKSNWFFLLVGSACQIPRWIWNMYWPKFMIPFDFSPYLDPID